MALAFAVFALEQLLKNLNKPVGESLFKGKALARRLAVSAEAFNFPFATEKTTN